MISPKDTPSTVVVTGDGEGQTSDALLDIRLTKDTAPVKLHSNIESNASVTCPLVEGGDHRGKGSGGLQLQKQ